MSLTTDTGWWEAPFSDHGACFISTRRAHVMWSAPLLNVQSGGCGSGRLKAVVGLALLCGCVAWGDPVDAQLDRLRGQKPPALPPVSDTPSMVIPEGEFLMGGGGADALEDEKPQHPVWLDRYDIDLHEATTAQYADFLAHEQRPAPWQWEAVDLPRHHDRPVIGVSWFDAEAYCRWREKRLPTEAEWEKAARGTDARSYPWGNQAPQQGWANFGLGARFSYSHVLAPVQNYEEGRSPYGLYQMAGNVGEWVADWYGTNYYEVSAPNNPSGPVSGSFRVVRGGSWSDLPKYLLTFGRLRLPPETRNSYTGFRCARSAGPAS